MRRAGSEGREVLSGRLNEWTRLHAMPPFTWLWRLSPSMHLPPPFLFPCQLAECKAAAAVKDATAAAEAAEHRRHTAELLRALEEQTAVSERGGVRLAAGERFRSAVAGFAERYEREIEGLAREVAIAREAEGELAGRLAAAQLELSAAAREAAEARALAGES